MRKSLSLFVFGLLICLFSAGCGTTIVSRVKPLPDDYVRQVVAVTSFENRSGFSGRWKLGDGMADLLISELVASEHFVIVERRFLDSVIGELERQHHKLFREQGKLQQGRLKNARYLVRGVITDFSQTGGGGLTLVLQKLFLGGKGHKARVAVTLTVIDIESGEVVGSVQCSGTARAGEAYIEAKYKNIAFGGDKFFKTPLGVATCNALRRGIRGLVDTIPLVRWQPMIAQVIDNREILINGGRDRGIREGLILYVRDENRPVLDPLTGDVLEVIPGPVLVAVRVVSVEERICYAEVVEGDTSRFKVGMVLCSDID